jgi:aerobic-type carbon monoxide dehydrogenase small subunit (CoxS/CutS family)
MKRTVHFKLNGESVEVEVEPWWSLLKVIREEFDLTGAKEGCGYGECGACTVLLDGLPVNSCLVLAPQVQGRDILTIEGLSQRGGDLHPLQKAFMEKGAIQCGFCTPGMILAAKALLDRAPKPTEEEIKKAIVGNLCRCTGYVKIIEAIKSVAENERAHEMGLSKKHSRKEIENDY